MKHPKLLITGIAGFIGYHLALKLANEDKYQIFGIDNINDYYDINLKLARLQNLGFDNNDFIYGSHYNSSLYSKLSFTKLDISNKNDVELLFEQNHFDYVINLAAQAGVRYSLKNPTAYIESNISGFLNILEASRHFRIKHLLYASTSSVYGLNGDLPVNENHNTDHPVSLYGATKKSNELMAHAYSHLFKIPTTGLRFFTVYGPYGRPDMALYLFADAISSKIPIDVFNHGRMRRDFTYVDDIAHSISRLIEKPPFGEEKWDRKSPKSSSSSAPYRILNIGNSDPVELMKYIETIEVELGIIAKKNYLNLQPGDVLETHSDTSRLFELIGYVPKTDIKQGILEFIKWFKKYKDK